MTEIQYVIEHFSTTSQIVTTILGFTIIIWIFWYENIGKHSKLQFGEKIKDINIKNFYRNFEKLILEKTIYRNLKKGRLPILLIKKSYNDLFDFLKLYHLYNIIKNKIKDKSLRYKYKKLNYGVFFSIYIFAMLVSWGIYFLNRVSRALWFIAKSTHEQLQNDSSIPPFIDSVQSDFKIFLIIFSLFITMILVFIIFKYTIKDNK